MNLNFERIYHLINIILMLYVCFISLKKVNINIIFSFIYQLMKIFYLLIIFRMFQKKKKKKKKKKKVNIYIAFHIYIN